MRIKTILHFILGAATLGLLSCSKDSNDTGLEFASQMYHSMAYEPYTQILDSNSEDYNSNPHNPHRMNMRKPVAGTIHRKQFAGVPKTQLASDIMVYDVHPDSIDWSAKNLINPIPLNDVVLKEGEALYGRYCSACHGAEGDGAGKVADLYKGVPAYNAGRVATVSEGHIFHTITHGKGRMWPHGSQVNPDERWKIVHFVKTLQRKPA